APAAPVTLPLGNKSGDELVDRLSRGDHPIEASLRPTSGVKELKARIDQGYVHINFCTTLGGTELGVRLEPAACDLSQADFVNQRGRLHLVGHLTLNYVRVRCIADLDLTTLAGQGHLEPVGD